MTATTRDNDSPSDGRNAGGTSQADPAGAPVQAAATGSRGSGEERFRSGLASEKAKDLPAAREAYRQALAIEPERSEWRGRLARIEEYLQDWGSAETSYRQALRAPNARPGWGEGLSRVLSAQGRPTEARSALLESLPRHAVRSRTRPRDAAAHVAWAAALHAAGFPEEALEIGVEALRAPGAKPSQRRFLLHVALAVGARGGIDVAISRIRSLTGDPALLPFIREANLILGFRLGYFDDEVMANAEQGLDGAQAAAQTALRAADVWFDFHGPSLRLAETMQQALRRLGKPRPERLLDLAAMLFALGESGRLQDLCVRHPELIREVARSPAVAGVVLRGGFPEAGADARTTAARIMEAHDAVLRGRTELWSELGDAALSVAVVGNSPCELGSGHGQRIDAHDRIVRFNAFSTDPQFAGDYGARTDVVVRIPPLLAKYGMSQGVRDIIIGGIRPLDRYRSWELLADLIEQGHRIAAYPPDLHQGLIQQQKRIASSGLTVTRILTALRAGTRNLSFYGFSFLDQVGPKAGSSHYFEQASPSGRHAWLDEAQAFRAMTGIVPHPALLLPPAAPCPGPRIRLLGDHSALHAGCAAVTDYLTKEIGCAGSLVDHDDFDVLVVNGEGSMHHDKPAHVAKMTALATALGRGKRAYLINSVWQANDGRFDHVLRNLDGIVVREARSLEDLRSRHRVRATARIDVSYWADVDAAEPGRDLDGATAVTDFFSREFATFVRPTGGWIGRHAYVDMAAMSWSALVATLRTAAVLVTGRHHAVFAACRARTPFVALRGNTHKIEGMVEMSGIPIRICDAPSELEAGVRWAKENGSAYQELFQWMDEQPRFRLGELLDGPAMARRTRRPDRARQERSGA